MSSLATVLSPSYRDQFLQQLKFLSKHPSQHLVHGVQCFIRHIRDWNSVGNDDSSADRIFIVGVTGETISRLVASAFNAFTALEHFLLDRWATHLYNAVALESQGESVVDNEHDSLQSSTLTGSTAALMRSSSSATTSSTSSIASTSAASASAVSLGNESAGDEAP